MYRHRCLILISWPPDIKDFLQLQVWTWRIPFPNNTTGFYLPISLSLPLLPFSLPHFSQYTTTTSFSLPQPWAPSPNDGGGRDGCQPKGKEVATKNIFLFQRTSCRDIHTCFYQNTPLFLQEEWQASTAQWTSLPKVTQVFKTQAHSTGREPQRSAPF